MIQFNLAVGGSYFVEIAKFKAFRVLWKTIVEQYHPVHNCSTRCFIHASTSQYLRARVETNNNLLRGTTQAMSAIIGRVNSLEVMPHDENQHSEFSLRIARNIQHLLIGESYFSESINAAEGSYYITDVTNQLIEKAWELFREIETRGGIEKADHYLQQLVATNAEQWNSDIDAGKRVLVGVNKYINK
jgi:methylmalonyl-CoA mutase